jgi:hypothetical protein
VTVPDVTACDKDSICTLLKCPEHEPGDRDVSGRSLSWADHWRLDKGKIDVSQVLELLARHSPKAICTIETFIEDIEPSLLWLKDRGYL